MNILVSLPRYSTCVMKVSPVMLSPLSATMLHTRTTYKSKHFAENTIVKIFVLQKLCNIDGTNTKKGIFLYISVLICAFEMKFTFNCMCCYEDALLALTCCISDGNKAWVWSNLHSNCCGLKVEGGFQGLVGLIDHSIP